MIEMPFIIFKFIKFMIWPISNKINKLFKLSKYFTIIISIVTVSSSNIKLKTLADEKFNRLFLKINSLFFLKFFLK
jgi:hypothetical protein